MDFVAPNSSRDFIAPVQTDSAYPARTGMPSVDGPIIYPEPQPDQPSNVVPFQRETGVDPSKIPGLNDLAKKVLEKPTLRVLAGGVPGAANQVVVAAKDPAGPATTAERLNAVPEEKSGVSMPWWGVALLAVGAGIVGYAIATSKETTDEPLVADMGDEEED